MQVGLVFRGMHAGLGGKGMRAREAVGRDTGQCGHGHPREARVQAAANPCPPTPFHPDQSCTQELCTRATAGKLERGERGLVRVRGETRSTRNGMGDLPCPAILAIVHLGLRGGRLVAWLKVPLGLSGAAHYTTWAVMMSFWSDPAQGFMVAGGGSPLGGGQVGGAMAAAAGGKAGGAGAVQWAMGASRALGGGRTGPRERNAQAGAI